MIEAGPANPTSPQDDATSDRRARLLLRLVEVFDEVAGIELDPDNGGASFVEQGVDSLTLTQVALQLKQVFGVKISFRELMETHASLDALAAALDQRMPADQAPAPAPMIAAVAGAGATAGIAAATGGSTELLRQVIEQQMAIMAQQLVLLGAAPDAPASPVVAPLPALRPVASADAADAAPATAARDDDDAIAHTRYDVKKAFGAIARIHQGETELTPRQRARLDAFIRRYIERTAASKQHVQTQRAHLADPRVVNGFRPLLKEIVYPIVIGRSQGAHLWDLDGNRYVDALNGFGMNLFGWQPSFVVDALRHALDTGYEIGPQHPLAGDVARQVCALTGNERAALCNTGSEAVMGTVRIARTVTGRRLVVMFSGAYHGIFDEVIVRGTRKRRSVPAAPGIMRSALDNVLVLDYGTEESLAIIRECAADIAAVLVEPVQSRRPDFQPFDFLRSLREITRAAGILYVFDEVVTGFRSHPGGIQALIDVRADLTAYGKVVGGGLPIGVIAGRREFMDALDGGWWQFGDASTPTVGVTYFAGTFVRHPLALVAAHAVLRHLGEQGPDLQAALTARSAAMVASMNAICAALGAPIAVRQFASFFRIEFLEDHPLQDLLFAMMRSRGIHVLDNFPCFLTTAHDAEDLAAIVEAFRQSVLELQESEFLPRNARDADVFDAARPPRPDARLGRDEQRRPAWFVANPDQPGKFMKVEP